MHVFFHLLLRRLKGTHLTSRRHGGDGVLDGLKIKHAAAEQKEKKVLIKTF